MKSLQTFLAWLTSLWTRTRHIPFFSSIESVINALRPAEKALFWVLSTLCILSSLILAFRVNNQYLVEIPSTGGSFTEGMVGSPRFVNPVLALSDTDKDLTYLVYSGLFKTGDNGNIVPDIADSYTVDQSGTTYDVILKNNIYFHDHTKVTVDDVIFTVQSILDPIIKSPKKSAWDGVQVEKVNESEIRFHLQKPYGSFLNMLTMGILPKHIWQSITPEEFAFSERNIHPIGSGPYTIEKVVKNSDGIPSSIVLSPWKSYTPTRPFISTISTTFFQNETELIKAYKAGTVDNMTLSDETLLGAIDTTRSTIVHTSLPRVFGIFFNQNIAPVFLQKEVREALRMATPKNKIIQDVLAGNGVALDGPTPQDIDTTTTTGDLTKAQAYLTSFGWKPNANGILEKKTKTDTIPLAFSITTSSNPELKKTAEILADTWKQLGASIEVKVFEPGDLSQNIIKGRKYDALLFGEVVKDEHDLYPFWHSSERNDPGLNISLYTNLTADRMLENIQSSSGTTTQSYRDTLAKEIGRDVPAIFLFTPYLTYVTSNDIHRITLHPIAYRFERFATLPSWYIHTDHVWEIFTKK